MTKEVIAPALPEWAEDWVPGNCGCGARLCRAACYCGGHVVCSESGWDTERCELPSNARARAARVVRPSAACPEGDGGKRTFSEGDK